MFFAIFRFIFRTLTVAFFSPPARVKECCTRCCHTAVVRRSVVVVVVVVGNAPNTETVVWRHRCGGGGGGVKRCLPPSATFFPAGVYTGPTAPETNHFARHGLYCIYIYKYAPASISTTYILYSVLWSIPQYRYTRYKTMLAIYLFIQLGVWSTIFNVIDTLHYFTTTNISFR